MIEYGVGDLVRDLVRVTFGDRFGREEGAAQGRRLIGVASRARERGPNAR